MGTKTRRGFLVATITSSVAILLNGCGGGTPDNTPYQGTYRSQYSIPGMNENGFFSFTVDIKGKMNGSFTNSSNSQVRSFSGDLKSTGRFEGSTSLNGASGSINGTLSTAANVGSTPGGDFTLSEGGRSVPGNFILSSDGDQYNPQTSQFRGAYSGSFTVPGSNEGGQVSYSIDSQGSITGSFSKSDETGLFSGQVQNSGTFTGSVAYASGPVSITGTLQPSISGVTVGNYVQTVGGRQVSGTFGPTTVVSGNSPFQGAYRGTYGIPESSESGNVSFTVDPSGSLTGFFSQANNSPVATFTGSFSNSGIFSGTLAYDPGSGLAIRPITGKLGTSTVGSGGLAGDFVVTINGSSLPGNMEVSIGASELDSIYRGTYSESNVGFGFSFPNGTGNSGLVPSGELSVTIDKQGSIVGTLGTVILAGRVSNDSRFVGTYGGFALRGAITRQQIAFRDRDGVPAIPAQGPQPGPDGVLGTLDDIPAQAAVPAVPEVIVFRSGFAGNLLITVNGVDYPLTVAGIGGAAGG
ncbi:MAG: hypothetical protein H7Z41_12610 [Cytophagales bacterium]|nr:hypothetical protein [Armatimonadota bacterium]